MAAGLRERVGRLDWEAIGPQQLRGLPAVTVVHRLVQ